MGPGRRGLTSVTSVRMLAVAGAGLLLAGFGARVALGVDAVLLLLAAWLVRPRLAAAGVGRLGD